MYLKVAEHKSSRGYSTLNIICKSSDYVLLDFPSSLSGVDRVDLFYKCVDSSGGQMIIPTPELSIHEEAQLKLY